MADDYYTCPNDVHEDERLEGASLAFRAGYFVLVSMADDWGLFDGNPRTMARRLGVETAEVEGLYAECEERNVAAFYEAEDGARVRRVGRVVDYHSYRGHPDRTAYESKRGASSFPFEDGSKAAPRRARGKSVEASGQGRGRGVEAHGGSSVAAPRKQRGSVVEESWKECGSDVAPRARVYDRDSRAPPNSTAQHSTAQPVPLTGNRTVHVAPVSAPHESAAGGGGSGAMGSNQERTPPQLIPTASPVARDEEPEPEPYRRPPPAGPPPPSPAQVACMALRWCGITGAEHSAALLAWARESGQQERKLRKWLEEREIPPVMHTYAEEVARKHSAQFAPGQTVTT